MRIQQHRCPPTDDSNNYILDLIARWLNDTAVIELQLSQACHNKTLLCSPQKK